MVLTVAFTVALWPSVRGQQQYEDLLRELPDAVRALVGAQGDIPFTSPAGYLQSRVFATVLPVLLLVFGIELGTKAVAAAEEDGTLEPVLAQPVTRARLLAERYAAMVALVLGLAAVSTVALIVMGLPAGVLDGVSIGRLTLATAAAGGLGLVHATVAFAAGCAFGRRTLASAIATTIAVSGYLLHGLTSVIDVAGPVRMLSPWHWYLEQNLLADTAGFSALVLPLVVSTALVVAGRARFARRDLRFP